MKFYLKIALALLARDVNKIFTIMTTPFDNQSKSNKIDRSDP